MNWFSSRSKEASSYSGLGLLVLGLGQLFGIKEAPVVAEGVVNAGQSILSGTPWWMAGLFAVTGILGVLKSDGNKGF